MILIKAISADDILDSRGDTTGEAIVGLSDGTRVVASVPRGASIAKCEAVELVDIDPSRSHGQGVLKAVANVNQIIAPKLIGYDVVKQGQIDQLLINLDGTSNKAALGTNAILAVSTAVCKAAADTLKLPLYKYVAELIQSQVPESVQKMPTPIFNIINGGMHGTGNLDIQEFHVIPATNKSTTMRCVSEKKSTSS